MPRRWRYRTHLQKKLKSTSLRYQQHLLFPSRFHSTRRILRSPRHSLQRQAHEDSQFGREVELPQHLRLHPDQSADRLGAGTALDGAGAVHSPSYLDGSDCSGYYSYRVSRHHHHFWKDFSIKFLGDCSVRSGALGYCSNVRLFPVLLPFEEQTDKHLSGLVHALPERPPVLFPLSFHLHRPNCRSHRSLHVPTSGLSQSRRTYSPSRRHLSQPVLQHASVCPQSDRVRLGPSVPQRFMYLFFYLVNFIISGVATQWYAKK